MGGFVLTRWVFRSHTFIRGVWNESCRKRYFSPFLFSFFCGDFRIRHSSRIRLNMAQGNMRFSTHRPRQAHAREIMGLPRGATQKEIKAAYRRLAREWHPDLNPDPHGMSIVFTSFSIFFLQNGNATCLFTFVKSCNNSFFLDISLIHFIISYCLPSFSPCFLPHFLHCWCHVVFLSHTSIAKRNLNICFFLHFRSQWFHALFLFYDSFVMYFYVLLNVLSIFRFFNFTDEPAWTIFFQLFRPIHFLCNTKFTLSCFPQSRPCNFVRLLWRLFYWKNLVAQPSSISCRSQTEDGGA